MALHGQAGGVMITVVCVYHKQDMLDRILLESLRSQTAKSQVILVDNRAGKWTSAASALNTAARMAYGKYIMFVHQDVEFGCPEYLEETERVLNGIPNLGIAGAIGMSPVGKTYFDRIRGHVQNAGQDWGKAIDRPEPVQTLDELMLVVPRAGFQGFDEETFDHWHCYGCDYALTMLEQGKGVYALPGYVYHRSLAVNVDKLRVYHKRLFYKHRKHFPRIHATTNGLTWWNVVTIPELEVALRVNRWLFPTWIERVKAEVAGCRTLLDVGCGYNSPVQYMDVPEKTGVEVFEPYLVESQKKGIHQQYYQADVMRVGFQAREFDVVFCFAKGVMVAGLDTRIEDVCAGEGDVLETYAHCYSGPAFRLSVLGCEDVVGTPEHPVLTTRFQRVHTGMGEHTYVHSAPQWVPMSSVTSQDWVIVDRDKSAEDFWLAYRVGRGVRRAVGRRHGMRRFKINRTIAKLLGLWFAEGHTHVTKRGGRSVFSLGTHEHELIESLRGWIETDLGLHPQVAVVGPVTRVMVDNRDLAVFLKQQFGCNAKTKRLPQFVKRLPIPLVRAFVKGWWLGDGDVNKGTMRIITASPAAASGLCSLLYKIGLVPSLYARTGTATFGRGKAGLYHSISVAFSKRAWDGAGVRDEAGRRPYLRGRVDTEHIYLPVKEVTQVMLVDEMVHNLRTVTGVYGVPFVVHNCSEVLEHLPFTDGMELLANVEKWAAKKVIITVPNGWVSQDEYDGNPYQRHRSWWYASDFRRRGYRVSGMSGLKWIRGEQGRCILRPELVGMRVASVSGRLTRYLPELDFQLLAIKDVDGG